MNFDEPDDDVDIVSKEGWRSRMDGYVQARYVLYFLSWSGFLVSFMMRNDINIAMVVMVKHPLPSNPLEIINGTNITMIMENEYCYDPSFIDEVDNSTYEVGTEEGEFDWSTTIQSSIIGSFYWCYILSQIVGGVATQRFGTKCVFGWSQLITALCSLAIPFAATWHYMALIALRSIQGFASGLTWPAMYAIVGHWIPAHERSRFMSSFQGFSIGIGITYPLCGYLIANWGWPIVFYTTGSVGVFWCILWYFLAFDTPSRHPRISPMELRYIETNVALTVVSEDKSMPTPWKAIMTSWPVWAIGITTFGRIWVHYTFIIPGPMYMKTVLGFSIQKNGLLSGAPFITSYIFSVFVCYIADILVERNIMTLTNVRKTFTAMSQIVPGLLCLLIGYLGCNIIPVLIFWFIAVTLITAAYAGAMANIVDLAPNLAGPVLAFAQTIHMTASFLSPIAAGELTRDSQSLEAWRRVFGLTAFVSMFTYIIYQINGTADVQIWNYPDSKPPSLLPENQEILINQETKKHAYNNKENGSVPEDV